MRREANKRKPFVLLIMLTVVVFTTIVPIRGSVQSDIPPPAGSGEFGTFVAFLPNGNIIVTDPLFDASGPIANVGAVHLFNGDTLALIASLTGSLAEDRVGNLDVVVLPNGNYVVRSTLWGTNDVGAVTFCNMTTGCNGAVSAANSLVGGSTNDNVGNLPVTILSDGDFVIRSTNWDKPSPTVSNVGATTFCSGTLGCPTGLVTDTNSLIGSTASDFVGNGGITALSNGNYVVRSSNWDNPSPALLNAGAVTFCNGTTGCTGAVSGTNSLIGTTASDQVGSIGVTALADGDFVVRSPDWDNNVTVVSDVGAATFCSGATGCTGTISSANSLVGTITNDRIAGSGATELANGNYVVVSAGWDNSAPLTVNAGAATWCNGTSGCTGAVTSSNSLFGSTNGDLSATTVTALPNGNYVVRSIVWDNGAATNAGAATFCLATGCTGPVSAANSLVGSTTNDNISNTGITFLPDSTYTVSSPMWDHGAIIDAGLVSFCSGITGCVGAPSALAPHLAPESSLAELFGDKPFDRAGSHLPLAILPDPVFEPRFVIPFPNASVFDQIEAGIVLECRIVECGGPISPERGLYGSANAKVGSGGVLPLPNGKYVVMSPLFDKGGVSNVGAVTLCNSNVQSSCKNEAVTAQNSLTGMHLDDCVGGTCTTSGTPGCTALSNGNYVCGSPDWNNGAIPNAGAATFCDSSTDSCSDAVVSPSNSAVGENTGDNLGGTSLGNSLATATDFPGTYFVQCPRCDNGPAADAGKWIYGAGIVGTTGTPDLGNAIIGTLPRATINESVFRDEERGRLVVGLSDGNRATVLRYIYTAVINGNWTSPTTWFPTGPPERDSSVLFGGPIRIMVDDIHSVNSVEIDCTGDVIGGSSNAFIATGKVRKHFCTNPPPPTTFTFPVGTATNGNHYSPVTLAVTNVAQTQSSLTVDVRDTTLPGLNPALSVSRSWEIRETGDLTADITFTYLDSDINGNEATYRPFKSVNGLTPVPVTPFTLDTVANTITVFGVSAFSDWGIGNLAPAGTASPTATPTETITPTNTPTDTPTSTPTDTPTATPTGPPMISGTVTYGNALGNPPPPRFVSNVLISGAGSVPVSVFTGGLGANEGQYSLSGFGAGSYTVTPTKTGGINGGISSFDAARIALHVAGPPNPQLNATQLIVADVSGNGVVSSFDAGMIAKFVAGPPYLPPGIGATGTWRFTPLNRSYASVTSNITGEDYVGLLMGEVSGNWNNTGARPVGSKQLAVGSGPEEEVGSRQLAGGSGPERPVEVNLPEIVTADKEFIVPVNVQGVSDKGIISYEFDLRYDPTVIQPLDDVVDVEGTVSRGLSVVANATEPGLLKIVVYGAMPIDVDGVLLNLRFTAVGAVGSVSPLTWERIMFNDDDPRVTVVDGRVELY